MTIFIELQLGCAGTLDSNWNIVKNDRNQNVFFSSLQMATHSTHKRCVWHSGLSIVLSIKSNCYATSYGYDNIDAAACSFLIPISRNWQVS